MANKLLTDSVIAKKALILLKNNLVFARLVYRDPERTFGKVGTSIQLKKPFRTKTASGRTLVKQPMLDETIPFKIDRQEHFGLDYTVKDKTMEIEAFAERYLKSGMIQLANVVDRSIALTIKNAYHTFGTPGTRPSKFIDFANAGAKQTALAVPEDGMRRAVLDPFVCAALSDEVTKLFKESMVEAAYKKGYKGPVSEYETYSSQNIPKHTVGDHGGTPLIAGVVANGDTITSDGWTVSKTGLLLQGDIITIEGVYSVNPQNYETTGMLQEFVVQADVDSSAGGLATIKVYPTLNDGNGTTTNAEGETVSTGAYQNVTALPVDNAPITVLGTANATYEQTYLFHRDAIGLAVINLEPPKSATVKEQVYDPESGLSLLLTQAYDIGEQTEVTRIDVVWGAHMINGDLAIRNLGAVAG